MDSVHHGARRARRRGVTGVTFNDLRGTFVTRSAIAGGTEAEIASITGNSPRSVGAILDKHYLHRDPALGENLFRKLESGTAGVQTGHFSQSERLKR
jgi:hypothetical protein